jgi:hypothetical protein
MLGELAPAQRPTPVPRTATASDLADELEPGTGASPRRRRRSVVPWLVLGVLFAGIAVVTTLIVLKKMRGEEPPRATGPFPELALEAARTIDSFVVVTDGTKPADTVAKVYGGERARLQRLLDEERKARGKPAIALPDKVRELFAVPQSALCVKYAYIVEPPPDCTTSAFAITIGDQSETGRQLTEPRLYLVSSRLTEAVRGAIAQVSCDYLDPENKDSVEICDFLKAAARGP